MDRARVASGFLRALYDSEDGAGHVVLFALPSRHARAFLATRLWEAGREAVTMAQSADVYFGVGLQREPPQQGKRGTAADVVALPGLWGDLDLQMPYRTRTNLPATVDEAMGFLYELPLRPTAVVHSGGGLQPWWAFKELWRFDSDEERERATRLSLGWQGFVQAMARRQGWEVDDTADLARILRLPGTLNHKGQTPAAVHLLEATGPRYVPGDFEDFQVEERHAPRERATGAPIEAGTPRRRAYVVAAIEAETLELANTPEGDRNNALNRAAFSLARFVATGEADPAKLADALRFAARHAGLGDEEIEKTIQSAFTAREVPA
jgi:hypothetical protein